MKLKKFAYVCMACATAATMIAFAGCGSEEDVPEGRVEITFSCIENSRSRAAWNALVDAYNNGQGVEDNVWVTKKTITSVSSSMFTQSSNYASNVVTVTDSQDAFQSLAIMYDTRRAPDGYFLDLTEYAEADEDFQNNAIPEDTLNWWRMTFNSQAGQGAGAQKHIIGEGQSLLGVPVGTNVQFNWYNADLFEAQGFNIISVAEEDLDEWNSQNNGSVQPHGYAEYKYAPYDGAKASVNLAGDTVYKVFNNRIGMNWEEMRNVLKYFTQQYNSSATTSYGFISEYWFNYGWSVGGDVMGYTGEEYDFTLLDQSPNYIVTKDGTVINGVTYSAGEIVRYEDRVNQSNIAEMDGVYAISSQYDAVKEYVSLQVSTSNVVDTTGGTTYYGYGVASPETGSQDNYFNTSQIAMVRGTVEGIYDRLDNDAFDICPCETYREYEGGSVYYDGGTDFANEYLKVIGETYDGEVYTGELKEVDGTAIVGNTTSAAITTGLVIPACSDPDKYQAAWDFISWVATEGQTYIAQTNTLAPVAEDVLFSDSYAYDEDNGKNLYAVAMLASNISRGDWGYFENGSWVTNWSNDFNNYVRRGSMTLSSFLNSRGAAAKTELNNMYCIIRGIR